MRSKRVIMFTDLRHKEPNIWDVRDDDGRGKRRVKVRYVDSSPHTKRSRAYVPYVA